MKIAVVIVNYRSTDLTIACLKSLRPELERLAGSRAVVVENASGGGAEQILSTAIEAENWRSWVTLLPLPENRGYAAGNNAAIRAILAGADQPQMILLLNPDTIVRPGAVAELVRFLDGNPAVGIAGSRLEDPDGTPQRSAFRFPTVWSELDQGLRLGLVSKLLHKRIAAPPVSGQPHETDWVAGASMMIRRELFDQIGLLDEDYFLYYEEVDFCHAARRAGWSCWYVPASHVVHLVGQSSGVTDTRRAPMRRPAYWYQSRRRYFVKNRGTLQAIIADLAYAAGFIVWRIRRPLQRKPDADPPHVLRDLFFHSALIQGNR